MKHNYLSLFTALLIFSTTLFLTSCELFDKLDPESHSEKVVRIFTGGTWKVDSLITKTDVLSGGVSNITSDSTFMNYGTIEFMEPNQTIPGYGAGFMIHRYIRNGNSVTDTLAWVPYNFISTSDGYVTLFISEPGQDFVLDAYDMYLDLNILEENKVRFSGWRRETIPGGSGGSYGSYRSYYLTR